MLGEMHRVTSKGGYVYVNDLRRNMTEVIAEYRIRELKNMGIFSQDSKECIGKM